jgi:[protein-PII] uridylyltransferase
MAKIALKLDELVDGKALRRDLAALAEKTGGNGSTPDLPLRQAVAGLM